MEDINGNVNKPVAETDVPVEETETVRVLRVLEYIGPRTWVEKTLSQGLGQCRSFTTATGTRGKMGRINFAIVGDWPEPVKDEFSYALRELINQVRRVVDSFHTNDPDLDVDLNELARLLEKAGV